MRRQKIRKTLLAVAFLLFPVVFYYFSPYLVIMGGSEGIVAGSLIVFVSMFMSSLFFGRAYCGWICPAGATQEMLTKIRKKPFVNRKKNLIKYAIWAPWISTIVLMFIRAGGVKAIDPLYQTYYGISIQDVPSLLIFLFFFTLIAALSLAAGRRGACHIVCWMAPFMIIGRSIRNTIDTPALQLVGVSSECINCKACNRNCPMSLEVNAMVQKQSLENPECILCGKCVDGCPNKAIRYNFGKKPEKMSVA
jgi:ferredoxin-type protein NapH